MSAVLGVVGVVALAVTVDGLWIRGDRVVIEPVEDCVDSGEETRGEVILGDKLVLGEVARARMG